MQYRMWLSVATHHWCFWEKPPRANKTVFAGATSTVESVSNSSLESRSLLICHYISSSSVVCVTSAIQRVPPCSTDHLLQFRIVSLLFSPNIDQNSANTRQTRTTNFDNKNIIQTTVLIIITINNNNNNILTSSSSTLLCSKRPKISTKLVLTKHRQLSSNEATKGTVPNKPLEAQLAPPSRVR